MIGPPLPLALSRLVGHPPDAPEIAALVAAYRARYRQEMERTPSFPGVPAAVRRLAATLPLAVATSKPRPYAERVVSALGLRECFVAVCGPALDADVESKAQTVSAALRAVGGRAVAMVGDRRYDVEGAHAHGLTAIGVTWGIGSVDELTAAGVDVLVEDPEAMVDAVLALAAGRRAPPHRERR